MPITGSFSSTQLIGSGIVTSSLLNSTLFDFRNSGNSAYLIFEDDGRSGPDIYTSSIGFAAGSSSISQVTLVSSSNYIFGVVIPSVNSNFNGTGSFTFTPSNITGNGNIRLRGTGDYSLNIKPSLLLDRYSVNVRVAYSVRKLSSTYSGNCIRVRNGSNVDADIGFDSDGNLNEAALLTHCGSGDGFIAKWYDQSGNGGDLEQTTDAQQPQIVSSGAVLKENGKPIITGLAASNGSHLDLSGTKTTYLPSTGQHYFFSVSKVSTDRAILYRENTRFQLIAQSGNTSTNTRNDPNYLSNTYRKNGASYSPTNRDEVHTSFSSQHLLTINGSLDNGVSSFVLGYGASNFANYSMQEFIVYEGDKASDQSNIETDINGHYSIF